jgi:hypothetical protein
VKIMGGDLAVESEQGVGSTFSFTLRFEKAAALAEEGCPIIPDLSEKRILPAEDIETNRVMVAQKPRGISERETMLPCQLYEQPIRRQKRPPIPAPGDSSKPRAMMC